jgi:hypothetical protein
LAWYRSRRWSGGNEDLLLAQEVIMDRMGDMMMIMIMMMMSGNHDNDDDGDDDG